MKIAVNQPYFFPYLGYFGLIKHTDKWIVFDTPQFVYHGWIERNRILKPVSGWQYISVPIKKHSRKTPIKDIEIRNDENWVDIIFAKLTLYKNIAPFYKETIKVIENSLSLKTASITLLNCNILKEVCSYIGIEWNYSIFSEMNLNIEPVNNPDEWALNICRSIGNVSEYWNLPGGISFFDKEKYIKNNINLRFFSQILNPYNQARKIFEPGLSIIDVMMFNSKKEIHKHLDNFNFIE